MSLSTLITPFVLFLLPLALGEVHVIHASGSSLLCPIMKDWSHAYPHTGISLQYNCTGSGTGKAQLKAGDVMLAGSDSMLTDEDRAAHPHLQMLPVVGAPVAIIYNLPGVHGLTLDRRTIRGIFSGRISRWDDPAIQFLNSKFTLPDAPIEVVAREDKSGTTEILTTALDSFGWEHGVRDTWPINATLKPRSSGLELYVNKTPYTIGYGGISSVVQRRIPFAVVTNRLGKGTSPRPSDAKAAMMAAYFNETTFPTLADTHGYPIMGVSYLIVNLNTSGRCEEWMRMMDFVYWVYTSSISGGIIDRGHLVGVSDSMAGTILELLWRGECTEGGLTRRWKDRAPVPIVTSSHLISRALSPLSIRYYRSSGALVSFNEGTAQRNVVDKVSEVPQGAQTIPYAAVPLVLSMNLGSDALRYVVMLEKEHIQLILNGSISMWNDSRLIPKNEFVPFPSLPIVLVADPSQRFLRTLCSSVACTLTSHVHVVSDVSAFVAMTPGSMGVVPGIAADDWKLSTVAPLVHTAEGIQGMSWTTLTVESLSKGVRFSKDLSEFTVNEAVVYPFVDMLWWTVPRDDPDCALAKARTDFMRWSLESGDGMLAAASMDLVLVSGVQKEVWGELRCEGRLLYPVAGKEEEGFLLWGLVIGAVVLLAVATAVFVYVSTRERRKMNALFNSNTLAAKTAEAVARLDFDSLGYLDSLQNPDRIQAALKSITRNMKEFVKYIPHHIIQAARGGGSDSDDDELGVSLSGMTPVGSKGTARTPSSTGKASKTSSRSVDVLGVRMDRQTRMCVVLVIRCRAHSSETDPTSHQHFLAEAFRSIEENRGTIHRMAEDHIVGTWGAMRHHAVKARALHAALQVTSSTECYCGIQAGPATCGSFGTQSIRFFNVLGRVVGEAETFSLYARGLMVKAVVSHALAQEGDATFHTAPFIAVQCPTRCVRTNMLLDVKGQSKGTEWMYELEAKALNSDTPEGRLIHALCAAAESGHEAAGPLLGSFEGTIYNRFVSGYREMVNTLGAHLRTITHAIVTSCGEILVVHQDGMYPLKIPATAECNPAEVE